METLVQSNGRGVPDQTLVVQVLNAAVIRNGRPLDLSPSERVLALALAVQTRPIPASCLCELLWPDRDDDLEAMRNSLKVYVYRLRRRVAADFVIFTAGGYALGPHVRTDVGEFGPVMNEVLRRLSQLSADERSRVEAIAREERAERPSTLLHYDWYASVCRRLARQGHTVTLTLAKDAFQRGDYVDAIRLASELIDEDSSDEAALELAIRAYLKAGEQGAAVREYLRYRTILADELDVTPSPHLVELVRDVQLGAD